MKHMLIVACLFVAVYGLSQQFQEQTIEKLSNIAAICVPEVKATDEDIGELMEKKIPTKKTGKCLVACFLKNMGIMKDGKYSKKGNIASLEPLKADDPELYAKALKIVDICSAEVEKETETDECELAVIVATCFQKAGDELGVVAENIMGKR